MPKSPAACNKPALFLSNVELFGNDSRLSLIVIRNKRQPANTTALQMKNPLRYKCSHKALGKRIHGSSTLPAAKVIAKPAATGQALPFDNSRRC